MREVAALAGVSLKTVSRVVNDEPGVSPQVREQVQRAVRHLDYRPNLAASSLRRSASGTGVVGVLVPDLASPATARLVGTLEEAASARGARLLVASLGARAEDEQALIHDLVGRRVDGIVLVPAVERQAHLRAELRSGIPVVVVDRPPRGAVADSVAIDHAAGARDAAAHLLARGHARVAALFPARPEEVARQRRDGFVAAFADRRRRPVADLLVTGLASEEEAAGAVRALVDLGRPPTAFVTAGTAETTATVRVLGERQVRGVVAHVALDDIGSDDLLDPPLTVVRYDVSRLGAVVADLLFERIGGRRGRSRRVLLHPSLVERGSGEIPPPG